MNKILVIIILVLLLAGCERAPEYPVEPGEFKPMNFAVVLHGVTADMILAHPKDLYIIDSVDANLSKEDIARIHNANISIASVLDIKHFRTDGMEAASGLMSAGYDGVVLTGIGGLMKSEGEAATIDLIESISQVINEQDKDFLIIAKDAPSLAVSIRYVSAIDGVLKMDTWYDGDKAVLETDYKRDVLALDGIFANNKFVLVMDTPTDPALRCDFIAKGKSHWFVAEVGAAGMDRVVDVKC